MAFKSLVPPSTTKPKSEAKRYTRRQKYENAFRQNLHPTTILLIGAVLQGTLVFFVPRFWILLPTVLVLFVRFADTLAITFHFRPNPYLEDLVPETWSTIIPDRDGNYSDEPANEKVAVLLLSTKLNHPLGMFSDYTKSLDQFGRQMFRELDLGDPSNGFLGHSSWYQYDARGATEYMDISYWRSADDIHNYANSPKHLEGMKWWNDATRNDPEGIRHIGIAHEIFEAPKGKWEAIALNFQPVRLGATTYLRKGDKLIGGTVEDQWISPVVAAKGRLRTSKGRMGRTGVEGDNTGSYYETALHL